MPRKPQRADLRLLSKVSKLYYHQSLTQQEIAARLHISRPKVSRLLSQAHVEGIVQITVHSPMGVYAPLEDQVEAKYGLKEALVVEVIEPQSREALVKVLGSAAASYFHRTLNEGDTIGISWGTTLNEMVNAMQPQETANVHIVQMLGGIDHPQVDVHGTSLSRRIAQLLGSALSLLHAPGVVDRLEVKQAILSDSHMQNVMEIFSRINVAYVGIGALNYDSLLMRPGLLINEEMRSGLIRQGAVGDIALRFFDQEGCSIKSEFDDRVIGITLEELKRIDHVVGIAGGEAKVAAIHGALQGGLIDVLITDHLTAQSLLTR